MIGEMTERQSALFDALWEAAGGNVAEANRLLDAAWLQAPVGDEGEETALARLSLVEVELTDEACCERCMGPEGCCDLCGGILRDGMVSDGGSLCLRCAVVGEEPETTVAVCGPPRCWRCDQSIEDDQCTCDGEEWGDECEHGIGFDEDCEDCDLDDEALGAADLTHVERRGGHDG